MGKGHSREKKHTQRNTNKWNRTMWLEYYKQLRTAEANGSGSKWLNECKGCGKRRIWNDIHAAALTNWKNGCTTSWDRDFRRKKTDLGSKMLLISNMLRWIYNSQLENKTGALVYRWGAEQRFHVRELNFTTPFFDYHHVFILVFTLILSH